MNGLLDPAALRELYIDLDGDSRSCRRFASDFIALWGGRAVRLQRSIEGEDWASAQALLHSIRCSALMLGATTLDTLAGMSLTAIERREPRIALHQAVRIERVGRASCRELREFLEFGAADRYWP